MFSSLITKSKRDYNTLIPVYDVCKCVIFIMSQSWKSSFITFLYDILKSVVSDTKCF